MKFFFAFSINNYKIRHAIAVELSKIFPGSRFAGGVPPFDNAARQYLEKQTDIKYEFLYDERDLVIKSLSVDVDFELLKEFEATLPEKPLAHYSS